MLSNENAAGDNGGAGESGANNSQNSSHYSAESILVALGCGRSGCPCASSSRRGRGLTHCPAHDDRTPSLDVTERDGKTLAHCHGACPQDAVIEALRDRDLWASALRAPRSGTVSAAGREVRHELHDEGGVVVAVHVRRVDANGKKIAGPWWMLPDGTKSLNGRRVETLPLYGVEGLRELPDGADVVLVEGETARDAVHDLGIASVATVCGANVTPIDDVLQPLVRLAPVLWPDNDGLGAKHMTNNMARLDALGATPMMMNWPDAPEKGDAADFVARGGTAEDVRVLMNAAEAWQPPKIEDGAALLNDLVVFIRRYVILSDAQAQALALWSAHTHAVAAAETTPYMAIKSVEKRSGKTRLLEVLELVVARPWLTGRVTAAALVRKVERDQPTLLLDESDAAFKGEKDYAEALRGILNNGHRRGGVASLCVGQGANLDVKDFSVFSPKAIAGIGKLPDTVSDRAIAITLKRKKPRENVERLRRRNAVAAAAPVLERLERWALAHIDALRDARPEIPDELDDRAQDGWEPLLAIADAAGGSWPQEARATALALSVGTDREDDSLKVRLLADVRAAFEQRHTDRLASAELVRRLNAIEESPWGDLRGKPLDPRKLARMLKDHGIRPHNVRVADGQQVKGYDVSGFADAFARYLPSPKEPSQASQASQEAPPDSNLAGPNGTDGTDGTARSGMGGGEAESPTCDHRPVGEADDLWTRGDSTWGQDPRQCTCCTGPVKGELPGPEADSRCPTCRTGQPVAEHGGHLVRHALDIGLELVEATS